MAVIQTQKGRVIGLIIENDNQPMKPETEKAEIKPEVKPEQAKRPGRPAKK